MNKNTALRKTDTSVIRGKLERLDRGGRPRVLDLFAGCGGISLGFHSAGFEMVGAVEIDEAAARSHALNFHRNAPPELFEAHAKSRDITMIEPDELLAEYGISGPPNAQIDVIISMVHGSLKFLGKCRILYILLILIN